MRHSPARHVRRIGGLGLLGAGLLGALLALVPASAARAQEPPEPAPDQSVQPDRPPAEPLRLQHLARRLQELAPAERERLIELLRQRLVADGLSVEEQEKALRRLQRHLSRLEAERLDGGRADGGRADGGRADGGRADGGRADGGRADGFGRADGGHRPDDGPDARPDGPRGRGRGEGPRPANPARQQERWAQFTQRSPEEQQRYRQLMERLLGRLTPEELAALDTLRPAERRARLQALIQAHRDEMFQTRLERLPLALRDEVAQQVVGLEGRERNRAFMRAAEEQAARHVRRILDDPALGPDERRHQVREIVRTLPPRLREALRERFENHGGRPDRPRRRGGDGRRDTGEDEDDEPPANPGDRPPRRQRGQRPERDDPSPPGA